jgi:hypothetical protein
MATLKLGGRSHSDCRAEDSQNAKHRAVPSPGQIPVSESDYRTICQLLVMSGPKWSARHVHVPLHGRNVVIIAETRPTGPYTANLLIVPLWNGYLVFFHDVTMSDSIQDYLVTNCQSMWELCNVISEHCGLLRTQSFSYAGVPYISDAAADDVLGVTQDKW